MQNSDQILYCCITIFCFLFEYSSDQEWNQTLNDAYIYEKGIRKYSPK